MPDSQTAVVITSLDLGAALEEAVLSVRAQLLAASEVVIVDDGSTDPVSRAVLGRLEQAHPGVRLLRCDGVGIGAARNLGVRATGAPLVALLDGDDAFEPEYLARAVEILEQRPEISFVSCTVQAFGEDATRFRPPPYTVADAFGRDACGHASSVFRRGVFDELDGFDPALPAFEDIDFWLRALAGGHHGLVLEEPLVRRRVRSQGHLNRVIARGGYASAKAALRRKHERTLDGRGADLLVTLLDRERELHARSRQLLAAIAELESETASVDDEISTVRASLRAEGVGVLDWGALARLRPPSDAAEPDGDEVTAPRVLVAEELAREVEPQLRTMARAQLLPDSSSRPSLVIEADDAWPGESRRYERIVIDGALEGMPDPERALRRCAEALRPGGQLLVIVGTSARGAQRLRGISATALRELLCESFPPEDVLVAPYGNLRTTIASATGAGELIADPAAVARVDPDHATVVAGLASRPEIDRRPGAARRPGPGRRRRGRREAPPARIDPDRGGRREAERRTASAATILVYHRLSSAGSDERARPTPPDAFAEQLALLADGYTPLTLSDLVGRALSGSLPDRAVAITLDGDHAENVELGGPLLAEHAVPATFFVSGLAQRTPPDTPGVDLGLWLGVDRLGDDPTAVRERVVQARSAFRQSTGREPTMLAYRTGAGALSLSLLAAELGFTLAAGTEPEPITSESDPLRLGRWCPGALDLARFAHELDRLLGAGP